MTEVVALVPADAAAILPVIHAAFAAQSVATDPPSAALRERAESLAAQIAAGGGFGVREGGRWLAALLWAEEDTDALHFGRLAVLPEARRRGFARALVTAVEAEAARCGKARVTLGVRLVLADNRRLFASCGYVETARTAHPGYAQPTSATMEKRITPQRSPAA